MSRILRRLGPLAPTSPLVTTNRRAVSLEASGLLRNRPEIQERTTVRRSAQNRVMSRTGGNTGGSTGVGKLARCLGLGLLALGFAGAQPACSQESEPKFSSKELQFFEAKIRPLLVDRCYGCHSLESGEAEGGLRLDSREAMLRGGTSGPAVVPKDPNRSLLVRAIKQTDANLVMPPKDHGQKLSDSQIQDIVRWIKAGAADPRQDAEHLLAREDVNAAAKSWWAYQPIRDAAPPQNIADADAASWCWNDIDRWISVARSEHDVAVAEDAQPEVLLRRLSFDLTGLPPKPEDVEAFVGALEQGAPRQQVIAEWVDRFLASPEFGGHWGRHWLDVARYAESTGRELNLPYNQAWRYRDWVIDALQNNMPYDRFLTEQIAGDLLPADDDRSAALQTIATGFLAVGSRNVNDGNPKQFALDQADEQIDTVFQATMGMTLACARCHDHKFEPISQRQYTAVAGVFLSTETRFGVTGGNNVRNGADAIALPEGCGLPSPPIPWSDEELSKKRGELKQLRERIGELLDEQDALKKKQAKAKGMLDRAKQQELRKLAAQANELEFQLSSVDEQGRSRPMAMGVNDRPVDGDSRKSKPGKFEKYLESQRRSAFVKIDDSPFFARGEISMPGEKIPRGVPDIFGDATNYPVPETSSGRLQLAQWIVSDANPLTARVAVNRIWLWLMGRGIVESVDNFGTTGIPPTHPELLDALAYRFRRDGWNVKQLIREIATSRTYQLASDHHQDMAASSVAGDAGGFPHADPENRWYGRGKSRRLQAEEIRDAMLMAAGRLDLQPQLATTMAKRRIGNKIETGLGRKRGKGEVFSDDICRSIYLPLPRNQAPDVLELFDLPDGTVVQGARETTNVPSQSLYLLNNATVAGLCGAIAKRVTSEIPGRGSENFEPRVALLYRLVLSRSPTNEEILLANELFKSSENSEAGWISLARGLLAIAEFRYLD